MVRFKKPIELVRQVDFISRFDSSNRNAETLYGLPQEVKYCASCVISNQRPNSAIEYKHTSDSSKATIFFDDYNVCDACRFSTSKRETVDWVEREKELADLCNRFRKNGSEYDCLVPGSGGKDSFYAAHVLRYKYHMNPLTVTWAPHRYTDWGWRNFQAWLDAGFDNFLMTPNPRMHRLLTRLAVENLFHPFQPFILGQKAFAPKMAEKFGISLVFYGENEAEYGNPISDTETAKRDGAYFTESDPSDIFLGGTSVGELDEDFGVNPVDLAPYMPISPDSVTQKAIEVHYLGYYLSWHPQGAYYYAVENGGFKPSPERTPGTYSKYNSIDDKIDDFHYFTTFIKFGIGRATYDAAQEIRNGEISREEGVALVKKYDGEFPERFCDEIFSYLSIPQSEFPISFRQFEQPVVDRDYFMALADTFRSPHIWSRAGDLWSLRQAVWET
jgi:N-acetyl sugar amidotransferase